MFWFTLALNILTHALKNKHMHNRMYSIPKNVHSCTCTHTNTHLGSLSVRLPVQASPACLLAWLAGPWIICCAATTSGNMMRAQMTEQSTHIHMHLHRCSTTHRQKHRQPWTKCTKYACRKAFLCVCDCMRTVTESIHGDRDESWQQ